MQLLVELHHLLIRLEHLLLRTVLFFTLLDHLQLMSRDILLIETCKLMFHLLLCPSMLIDLLLLLGQLLVDGLSLHTLALSSVSLIRQSLVLLILQILIVLSLLLHLVDPLLLELVLVQLGLVSHHCSPLVNGTWHQHHLPSHIIG